MFCAAFVSATMGLSELVAHPDFMKLLADVSIYVNGVAAMQIHNLNAWVEAVRAKIVDEYQPGEQDMDALLSDAILLRERDLMSLVSSAS